MRTRPRRQSRSASARDAPLAARLRDHHDKIDPVLALFRRKEFVVTVDARPDPDTVQREIRVRLGLNGAGQASGDSGS